MTKLTIKEAAAHFNVSERTIRRWIAAGELQVERVAMRHGEQVFILVGDTPDDMGDVRYDVIGDTDVSTGDTKPPRPVEVLLPTVFEQGASTNQIVQTLLAALDKQSERIAELGERVGRAEERADQAEQRAALLEQELHDARAAQPDAEPTPQAAAQPAKRVPWWRRLFADI